MPDIGEQQPNKLSGMNASQKPSSQQDLPPIPRRPLWETIVIAASFGGVWIYFLAWIAAGRAKAPLSAWWQFLLVPCLVLLFIVLRRRMARAQDVLREDAKARLQR